MSILQLRRFLPLRGGTLTGLLTTNGQIAFPATQNASAGANVLDDYEEGNFTPSMSFGTPGNSSWAYGTQIGRYTKIGRLCLVAIALDATPTIGTGSGTVSIDGLPFAAFNSTAVCMAVENLNTNWSWGGAGRTMIAARLAAGASSLTLSSMGSTLSAGALGATNMTTGTSHLVNVTGAYMTA